MDNVDKDFRCNDCGEVARGWDLMTYAVENEHGTENRQCTTCGSLDNFTEIEGEAVEVEYCKHCGEETEYIKDGDSTCDDCHSHLNDFGNDDLMLAIKEEFGCDLSAIEDKGNSEYYIDGTEYYVYTLEEANDRLIEYVEESLWAFSSVFLSDMTGLDMRVFEAIADNDKCEGNNEIIQSILDVTQVSMEDFAEEAIRLDGRGHFLNSYDGTEIEITTADGYDYCIYRI